MEQDSRVRIALIDGLRGISILWIVSTHTFASLFPTWPEKTFVGNIFSPLFFFANGNYAVPVFFLLSGFVLHLPYALGTRSMASWSDIFSYYKRRARRLLPLYFSVGIVLYATLAWTHGRHAVIPEFFIYALFLYSFTAKRFPSVPTF